MVLKSVWFNYEKCGFTRESLAYQATPGTGTVFQRESGGRPSLAPTTWRHT